MSTEWITLDSFLIRTPPSFFADSLEELRRQVQQLAADQQKDFGELTFKYELDSNDVACVVYAEFVTHRGLKRRFVKLKASVAISQRDILRHRRITKENLRAASA